MGEEDRKLVNEHLEYLKLLLDIYKHHFDLFLKAMLLYLAAVGAIASFIFSGASNSAAIVRLTLAFGIPCGSIIALVGCLVSNRWIMRVEKICNDLTDKLEVPLFPFSGARQVVRTMIAAIVAIAIAGVVNMWML